MKRGFTLIELTLSIAMLVMLTVTLFGFLRSAMGIYKSGESRRDLFERGQVILDQVARDLESMAAAPRIPGIAPEVRLLGDRDLLGRPRLRMVRSLGDETSDPVLRSAGTVPSPTEYVDQNLDLEEARAGSLKAPSGRMEVAYLAAAEGWIYRGIRSPVGGPDSYFVDRNLPGRNEPPGENLKPMTSGVLFFGFRYRGRGEDGSLRWMETWDSTRALLTDFELHRAPASLDDPLDDLFPRAVEVELILEEEGKGRTLLTERVAETGMALPVNSTRLLPMIGNEAWVQINEEWFRVKVKSAEAFQVIERGARGSLPVGHAARSRLRTGFGLTRIVSIPVARESFQ